MQQASEQYLFRFFVKGMRTPRKYWEGVSAVGLETLRSRKFVQKGSQRFAEGSNYLKGPLGGCIEGKRKEKWRQLREVVFHNQD